MSVRKRTLPSGEIRWQVDYRDKPGKEGKRRSKQFRTQKEAISYETKVRGEIAAGTHVAASASITVAKAGEEWLERCELEQLEASTIRQYRQHLNLHILPRLGSTKLSELTKPMVGGFRDKLLKENSRPLTRAIVTSLKGLLKEAQERGRVGQNVAADTGVKHSKRGKKKVKIPTKAELKAMVERAAELWPLTRIQKARDGKQRITPVPWRPLVVTALFSGLRLSELRGLTWRHVNLKGGIIEVRQRADFRNEIGNPKSEAGTRDVPVPPVVTQLLREWKMACPKTADGLVFPTENGTIIYTSNIHQQCWRPLLRALGLMKTEWLLRTQERWTDVLPDNLASAQSENELQRMILRGVAQGARISDIARSLKLSRAQARQIHKAALLAKAVPVLIYFKTRDIKTSTQQPE